MTLPRGREVTHMSKDEIYQELAALQGAVEDVYTRLTELLRRLDTDDED